MYGNQVALDMPTRKVDGDLWDALGEEVDLNLGWYVIQFTKSGDLKLNPAGAAGGMKWRNVSIRNWKGPRPFSIFKHDGVFAVMYRNGKDVLEAIADWAISPEKRNKIAHALNGNGKTGTCSYCALKYDKKAPHHTMCPGCWSAKMHNDGSDGSSDFGGDESDDSRAAADAKAMGCPKRNDTSSQKSNDSGRAKVDKRPKKDRSGPTDDGKAQAEKAKEKKPVGLWATMLLLLNSVRDNHSIDAATYVPGRETRNDGTLKRVIMGAGPIDEDCHIITFDHHDVSEEYRNYSYVRQRNMHKAAVNGSVEPIHDWIYSQGRMGEVGGKRFIATSVETMVAEENGRMINVSLFMISKTTVEPEKNFRHYEVVSRDAAGRSIKYTAYRGANRTGIICGTDDRVMVPTNVFTECGRYFTTTETSRVAESTLRGALKNNHNLEAHDMDALLRFWSAYHQDRLFPRAAALGGRPSLWRRCKDALDGKYEQRPWWMPSFMWWWVDPYGDVYSSLSGLFMSIALIVLVFVGAFHFEHFLGFAASSFVSGFKVLREAVGTGALRDHAEFDRDFSTALRFGICGKFLDYSYWVITGDKHAGWGLEDSGCPVWGEMGRRIAHHMLVGWDMQGIHSVFIAPIYEEMLKHASWWASWWGFQWLMLAGLVPGFVRRFIEHKETGFVITCFILLCESATYGWQAYWMTACVHLLCFHLPMRYSIPIHMIWNACTISNTRRFFQAQVSGSLFMTGLSPLLLAPAAMGVIRSFRKIGPMGVDSEFADLLKDPIASKAFPMKEDSSLKFTPTKNRRGKSNLVCLLQPFVAFASFASSQGNILHSLAGRVLKATPPCIASLNPLTSILKQVSNKMGGVEAGDPVTWASKFPAQKRSRYLKALLTLSIFGFAFFDSNLLGSNHKWDERKCFLKHEINLCQLDKIVDGDGRAFRIACSDPRTIQASCDEIQAALGPFFCAAGERASEVFDGSANSKLCGWRICVGFGRTKTDLSIIMREMVDSGDNGIVDCGDDAFIIWNKEVYAVDAARWDAHVGPELLSLKRQHLLALGMHRDLVDMVDALVSRRGKYDGARVRFTVEGDVASGDADTLYWNTICGIVVILASAQGATDFEDFQQRSKAWGIEYELAAGASRSSYDARLDFCSCVFVPGKDGKTLAPKLGRSLLKLSASANSNLDPAWLLASKIQGLTHDLAVFPEIVSALRSILPELPSAGPLSESYFPMGHVEPGTLDERRAFFSDRYGLDYDDVARDVRTWVSRSAGDGVSNDLWRLQRMVAIDYGKEVLPAEEVVSPAAAPRRQRTRGIVQCMIFFGLMFSLEAGGVVKTTREFTTTTTSTSTSGFLFHEMKKANGKKNNNNNGKTNVTINLKSDGKQKQNKKKRSRVTVRGYPIKGKGMYSIGAGLAGAASMIPRGTFEHLGGRLGAAAGRGLANFTGVGDYVFNDIVHTPSMPTRAGQQLWRMSNCEFIRDFTSNGTANFDLRKFSLNPADSGTFPWLSRVARLYQKYKFEQLIFEFRSNTSDYAASGPLGNIIMAPTYNVLADDPQTKQQMEAYAHAVSTKPSNSIMCGYECDPRESNIKWYYLRAETGAPTQFTDPGALLYAHSGLPGTQVGAVLGELWVHYTVTFDEPILTTAQANASYTLQRVVSNEAGLVNTYFCGIRATGDTLTAIDLDDPVIPASAAQRLDLTPATGIPTVPYFVGVDNAYTAGTRFWFSAPGTYVISWDLTMATGYTTVTAGTGANLYAATVASGSATVGVTDFTPVGSGTGNLAGTFTITTTTPNVGINITKNPGVTTTGSPVLGSTTVRITRL